MKKQTYFFALIFLIFLLANVSAEVQDLGYFQTNTCVSLPQICSTCTYNNISTIKYPNASTAVSEVAMTKSGTSYSYSFCNTSDLGQYIVNGYGDMDSVLTTWVYNFHITGNGKPDASGSVIVLFCIAFLILVGLTCYLAIYTLGHLIALDFDIIDLAFDWGLFFMICGLYFLEVFYLGNTGIEKYLLWFMSVGGIFLVVLPLISFILSITIGSLSRSKNGEWQMQQQRTSWRRNRNGKV